DSETVIYTLTLQNQTLSDLSKLTVDYIIFIERPKLGQKFDQPSQVDRVSGTQAIDLLTNRAPQSVTTSEIKLGKSSLVGGWSYDNGGRIRGEGSGGGG